ncbi:hypothetical protein [Oricola sp.]|uniref:hypothetical protein n=1 Tax=Oricola sp. TaxID=1979950 RepID=UPI0025DE5117|nr:hypothetical protein [Oricola sp.]MCI5074432.1 hypothetical protein [Oricola sp.]
MLQSVLIFTLGFLAASLLALVAAPAIWRRAVYLTRKRIEAALPLTINELNAEKDALRAEHAMAMRRLELRLKDTREVGASEKLLVEAQTDRIKTLEKTLAEVTARREELQRQVEETSTRSDERVTELSETSVLLESTRSELELRGGELKATERERAYVTAQLEDASAELRELNEMLNDRETQIEALYDTIGELKATGQDLKREVHESNEDGQTIGDALTIERKRAAKAEAKLEGLTAEIATLQEKLQNSNEDRKTLRQHEGEIDTELRRMEERAEAAEAAKAELEQQLQQMTGRLDGMAEQLGDERPNENVEALQEQVVRQAAEISALETERDAMKVELAAASFGTAAGFEGGDDVLREKLNELAAEVVAMAARLEGPGSPIPALLQSEGSSPQGKVISLAERIKALQDATNEQRNRA